MPRRTDSVLERNKGPFVKQAFSLTPTLSNGSDNEQWEKPSLEIGAVPSQLLAAARTRLLALSETGA